MGYLYILFKSSLVEKLSDINENTLSVQQLVKMYFDTYWYF